MTALDPQAFMHPAPAFSPAPLWFWNGRVTCAGIRAQLADFRAHGVMAFVLHPRMGLSREIGYLTPAYFSLVRFAVAEAARHDMRVILYDEGMYPSGSACGGVVRENPAFAARGLRLWVDEPVPEGVCPLLRLACPRTDDGTYEADGARVLASDAMAAPSERLLTLCAVPSRGTIRGVHFGQDDGERDAPPAADLLNPAATDCFIRLTHERYYAALAPFFGSTVIAMFTDEPNPLGRNAMPDLKPWTEGLETDFFALGGRAVDLPALWLDGCSADKARKLYDRVLRERLLRCYYRPLSAWCHAHGIALTGHPAEPDAILLERLFGIPGQDLVWRWVAPEHRLGLEGRESTQAKCASDAARHDGKTRVLSEMLGCCGPAGHPWALNPDDVKWYIDWLLVRGVNLLCPHAFLYDASDARTLFERPPDVGPNNCWWPYAGTLHLYMARLCYALSGGVNATSVAVLCHHGHLPWRKPADLYEHQVEFNYLEDDRLLAAEWHNGALCVQAQRYSVVAVEDDALLSDALRDKLAAFVQAGGCVLSPADDWATALSNMRTAELSPACRDVRVTQMARDGRSLFFFTNEGETDYVGTAALPVPGAVERWDAWTGAVTPTGREEQRVSLQLPVRGSVLLVVDPSRASSGLMESPVRWQAYPSELRWRTDKGWHAPDEHATLSGTVLYEATLSLPERFPPLALDLGMVRELALVSVNGLPERALLLRPYQLRLDGLRAGVNTIRVRVITSRVTELEGAPWPGGLLGPVRVLTDGELEVAERADD